MWYIILFAIYGIVELILFIIWCKNTQKKKRMIEKALYKFLEDRVLNTSLQYQVTTEQAALVEYEKLFLCIDFIDTKPHIMHIFSLDECVTIGRSSSNVVCIRDSQLSRVHCKISLIQNHLYLQDSGSKNGTRIKRGIFKKIDVSSQKMEELYQGDIIIIGNYRLKINTYYGREAKM